MKLRVEAGSTEYLVDLRREGTLTRYLLAGALSREGAASIEELTPGVFSILDGRRSVTVRLVELPGGLEAWIGNRRTALVVSDPRDRPVQEKNSSARGPQEIRSLMPGKVVKILVTEGDRIEAGTGVIVVEAMKMQNEMKALKGGRVMKIQVVEGATVSSGESLLIIE